MDNQNIKGIINQIFKEGSRLSKGFNQYTIEQVWRSTFGDVISKYTSSVKYTQGKLIVYITSSSLKQELVASKAKVIDKMNMKLPHKKIVELIIR